MSPKSLPTYPNHAESALLNVFSYFKRKDLSLIANPKIILTTLNAKFIHSSLALRSLKAFSRYDNISIIEFTINNDADFILGKLFKESADIIAFSCYIWNIDTTLYIINTIKKVAPNIKIIVGGPEVSFDEEKLLSENEIDFVVSGEGELPFKQLIAYFLSEIDISEISGISYRKGNQHFENARSEPLDLQNIDFVYKGELDELQNRIIYYEATRGCPFNCSYCLSSTTNSVRFLPLDRVFSDLDFFLENRVKQVKFVDRTFNWNKKYCLEIWKYLIENDNLVTNFHFEICAELLQDEHLEVLKQARVGFFQFEIGVQSTNEETLKYIDRSTNLKKLFDRVVDIKNLNNIHLHLDLIAGLPKESYSAFSKSFNDVYALSPEQLQLGFLKVLKGSNMRKNSEKLSLIYRENAPYEILYTDALSFSDLLKLKEVEDIVDTFYNSRKFVFTCIYASKFFSSPFHFFENLSHYWQKNQYDYIQHTKWNLYLIVYEFFKSISENHIDEFTDILKFDMLYSDVIKSKPEWLPNSLSSLEIEKVKLFYRDAQKMKKIDSTIPTKQSSKLCQIEKFNFDIETWIKSNFEVLDKSTCFILFNYSKKKQVNADGYPYQIITDEIV